jgi:hypothetical protein
MIYSEITFSCRSFAKLYFNCKYTINVDGNKEKEEEAEMKNDEKGNRVTLFPPLRNGIAFEGEIKTVADSEIRECLQIS